MLSDEENTRLVTRLGICRQRLSYLLDQQAAYGTINTPPATRIDIENARTEIRELKGKLRKNGCDVVDEADDEPPPEFNFVARTGDNDLNINVVEVISRLLDDISRIRIQAEDWKVLHGYCHKISLDIMNIRRGMNIHRNLSSKQIILVSDILYHHWTIDCSDNIRRFIMLVVLRDGVVKDEFRQNNLFRMLPEKIEKLDNIVNKCTGDDADLRLHIGEIVLNLQDIEHIIGKILAFIDDNLQGIIQYLDKYIQDVRCGLDSQKI